MNHLLGAALASALLTAGPAGASDLTVPERKPKAYYVEQAEAASGRSARGYLPMWSAIIFPLDTGAYAILNGVILGRYNGDSFHYFENADLSFTCDGTGKPETGGGIVDSECYLSGESVGAVRVQVPDYGKVRGTMTFPVSHKGTPLGNAVMRWGFSLPSARTMRSLVLD